MNRTELIGMLSIGRIAIVVLVLALVLYFFLRKRENRHSMDGKRERNIDEIRAEGGDPIPTAENSPKK